MSDCSISKTDSSQLTAQKQSYLEKTTGPLDGMWECFVAMADHYAITSGEDGIGYCVVNPDDMLLQFDVADGSDKRAVFRQCLSQLALRGAFVSSREPNFLSLCLDEQKSVAVNAFLYHLEEGKQVEAAEFPAGLEFRLMSEQELAPAVDFGAATLGADRNWLTSYFTERITRQELFGLWEGHALIATGECRGSDTQPPFADLGMMVSKQHRRRGLATSILRHLLNHARAHCFSPICSTERDNFGAQKAIEKSGFVSHHRILEIQFQDHYSMPISP